MMVALKSIKNKIEITSLLNRKTIYPLKLPIQYFIASIKLISRGQRKKSNLQSSDQIQLSRQQQKQDSIKSQVSEMIYAYPFGKKFNNSVQEYNSLKIEDEIKHTIIAWRCLQTKDKKQLRQAYNIILPEKYHLQMVSTKVQYTGQSIFTDYYEKKIPSFVKLLNSESTKLRDKLQILNILAYMKGTPTVKNHVRKISTQLLEKRQMKYSGLLLSYIVSINAKCNLPFADHLPQLELYLKQTPLSQQKLRAVFILSLLPYFFKYYPTHFVRDIFAVLKRSLSFISCRVCYICLKKVYQSNSKYACEFAENLINYIIKINLKQKQQSVDYLIPLIFKTINYCSVLKVNYQKLVLHIIDRIQNYNLAFQTAGMNKEHFISRLFLENKGAFSQAGRQVLSKHIFLQGKRYLNLAEIDEVEYIDFLEVVNMYQRQLEDNLINNVSTMAIQLLKKIDHPTSQFQFKSLQFVLIKKYNFRLSPSPLTEKQLEYICEKVSKYLKTNSSKLAGNLYISKNINECIRLICYSYSRKLQLKAQDIPNVCLIKYRQLQNYSMDKITFESLLVYLMDAKSKSLDHLKYFFQQAQSIIFSFLKRGETSVKSVLILLQLAALCGYKNINFSLRVIEYLTQVIKKYPNFILKSEDIEIIDKTLSKQEFQHNNFKTFLSQIKKCPEDWEHHKKIYLQNERFYNPKRQSSINTNSNHSGEVF